MFCAHWVNSWPYSLLRLLTGPAFVRFFSSVFPSSTECWNYFFRHFTCLSISFVPFLYFHLIAIDDWVPQAFPVSLQYVLRFVLPTHAPVSTHSSSGWTGFGSGGEMLSRAPHIYNCISSFSWAIFSCRSTTQCKGFA